MTAALTNKKSLKETRLKRWHQFFFFFFLTYFLVFQFVLTEMYYDGFHRSFCDDDDDLDIIQESDSIFAFETPETFKLENIRTKRGKSDFFRQIGSFSCKIIDR